MTSNTTVRLEPTDVSNSKEVKAALKIYLDQQGLIEISDFAFCIFDHGFVIAACQCANLKSFFKPKRVLPIPTGVINKEELVMIYEHAVMPLNLYIESRGKPVSQRDRNLFVAGFVSAFYLYY